MSINNPLLVPIRVEAFTINQGVLQNQGLQRWKFNYNDEQLFSTPQPSPFTGTNDLPGTGMILHWQLPDIMRRGSQNSSGSVDYPLVPNRWLVVRYNGPATARTAVAWVVQSDALGNSDPVTGGAPYLQPNTDTIQPTYLGQVVSLSNWTEPNPPGLFLTAVAPGNNMFASFQPYCWNVFSIYDPLTGVADQDTLSYMLAGWYSNPGDDILGSWQNAGTFDKFLEKANWKRAIPGTDTSTMGIYHSMVWGINWDLNGNDPDPVPAGSNVKIALGNTAVDALTALVIEQAKGNSNINPLLLEALQYGLLQNYDMPDAIIELQQQIEQGWFGHRNGSYGWEIVDAPVDPSQGNPVHISRKERETEEA